MAADRGAIAALVARSSPRSRRQRFQGAVHAIPQRYLERVCRPESGDLHLVALAAARRLVALGSLSDGEVGLLVEDEWQGAGIGSVLLRRLLLHGGASGTGAVVADVGAGNGRVLLALRRLEPLRVEPLPYGWRVVLDPWTSVRALDRRARVRGDEAA